jgi:hypothetical protein
MTATIEQRFQVSLDESRLLMLATQILFGFQLSTVFTDQFRTFTLTMRQVDAAALLLMVVALALLLTPPSQHRLVERGHITGRVRTAVTRYTEAALLPFCISLGLDIYLVFTHGFGESVGIAAGTLIFILSLLLWYVAEFVYRVWILERDRNVTKTKDAQTDIVTRCTQLLTEARIALPGAQALLGFQLAVMMTGAFKTLPEESRLVHGASLLCIAVCLVLLVAPAAFHRIAFDGNDTEQFYGIGARMVTLALLPLALGVSGDIYVAMVSILANDVAAIATAAGAFVTLSAFWLFYPLFLRHRLKSAVSS